MYFKAVGMCSFVAISGVCQVAQRWTTVNFLAESYS